MSAYRTITRPMVVAFAAILAVAPAYAGNTYTVSGLTFDKPQNVSHDSSPGSGSNQHERRDVRAVEEESEPDTRASERAYREQQAAVKEQWEEKKRQWKEQQKQFAKEELARILSNDASLAQQLRVAAITQSVKHQDLPIDISDDNSPFATRRKTLEQSIEDPTHKVELLRSEARDEYFWFQMNQYDLFWGAIGAGLDPTGPQSDLDTTASEAASHLRRYLDILRVLESINHTAANAQARYAERVKELTIKRRGSYNVDAGITTAKTDIYPPVDEFAPWTEKDLLNEGTKCKFDFKGVCR